MRSQQIRAFAIPMTSREEPALVENFVLWSVPALAPVVGETTWEPIPLIIVLNRDREPAFEFRVSQAFERSSLGSAFSHLEFRYCGLAAEKDRYVRDRAAEPTRFGHKAGPNYQFLAGMRLLRDIPGSAAWIETDCYPVRPGWLERLDYECQTHPDAWVIGSTYRGVSPVDKVIRGHLNGNAIYRVGDASFQSFVADTWRRAITETVERAPWVAYDFALDLYFEGKITKSAARERKFPGGSGSFVDSEAIANFGGAFDVGGLGDSLEQVMSAHPKVALLHGRHFREALMRKYLPASEDDGRTDPSSPVEDPQPFDAVLVHQMGKVGSASLFVTLDQLRRWPVYHTHRLNPRLVPRHPDLVEVPQGHTHVPGHLYTSVFVRTAFLEQRRPVAVLTGVRDPLSRNVSAFFQNLHHYKELHGLDDDDPASLLEFFLTEFDHDEPDNWFDSEVRDVFGVDIFRWPFDPEKRVMKGLARDGTRIMIYRSDLPDGEKASQVAQFLQLDRPPTLARSNVGSQKDYAAVYVEFKKLIGRQEAYVERMTSTRLAKHFFSEAELQAIREVWAGKAAESRR